MDSGIDTPRAQRETLSRPLHFGQPGHDTRSAQGIGVQTSICWLLAKRAMDIVGSIALLVLLAPLFLILSALTRLSGSPVFFSQQRIGRNGLPFKCLKFRTMIPEAEKALVKLLQSRPELQREWQQTCKLREDPRVTRIGAFMRRSSLDELPQLLNVLRGEMSLVGPRPIVEDELKIYARAARWYLAARPGMTGLWQISGRSDTGYRRRIALDTYYVRNQRLLLDLLILLKTIGVVARGGGAY
jgi:lipopolysaccharide/colanic/teichoic acid biosynthesis glycosyltransferase